MQVLVPPRWGRDDDAYLYRATRLEPRCRAAVRKVMAPNAQSLSLHHWTRGVYGSIQYALKSLNPCRIIDPVSFGRHSIRHGDPSSKVWSGWANFVPDVVKVTARIFSLPI